MKAFLLRNVPLFASLPEVEISHLSNTLTTIDVGASEVIVREGEPGDSFFVIMEGQVEVFKALGEGQEQHVAFRNPGSFFGEMSLLMPDGRRTASVRSVIPTRLLRMTRAEFDLLLHRHPAMAYEMVHVLSNRLSEAHNHAIAGLQQKNALLQQAYEDLKSAQAQLIEKEKLEKELAVARQIQQSMLPTSMPRLAGFQFGVRMEPARAIGGDLYDFINLGKNRLGIAVGDVSDKGVPAAMFMALTRSLLRVEAKQNDSAVKALKRVNHIMLDMNKAGMFVTVLYGILEGETGKMTFARAGHPAPLVLDKHGRATQFEKRVAQPLGIIPKMTIDEQETVLDAGSTLFMYSDGVTEASNHAGEMYGSERLLAICQQLLSGTPRQACDKVFGSLIDFRGSAEQSDDITVLAVKKGSAA